MNTSYVSIVINPSAGNGKAKRIAQSLLQKIKSASDFEISINFTRGKNDATLIQGSHYGWSFYDNCRWG